MYANAGAVRMLSAHSACACPGRTVTRRCSARLLMHHGLRCIRCLRCCCLPPQFRAPRTALGCAGPAAPRTGTYFVVLAHVQLLEVHCKKKMFLAVLLVLSFSCVGERISKLPSTPRGTLLKNSWKFLISVGNLRRASKVGENKID